METILSIILILLLLLIILGLFSPRKNTQTMDFDKLVKVRDDMNYWFTCMKSYMTIIDEHQKNMVELKKTLNQLNSHFIMTNSEIEKHFPAVNNKTHIKPKLTLVKKQITKLTKKENKNAKPKK